jgi:hypothetical protein
VRHADVQDSPLIADRYCSFADTAPVVADPQIRNRGTVVGSIAQADPKGDWGSVLLAHDGEVVARGPDGERTIDADDFFVLPYETDLGPDELITEVRVPAAGDREGSAYHKLKRKVGDYAMAGAAARLAVDGGLIDDATVALTAVDITNVRATDAEGATSAPVCIDVAVYDPDGGFVTGGGWYDSPEGAYKTDESVTGKATFGFVSKYQKGADEPKGNTQFRFRAVDLNFKSDDYEWLVVSGNTARYKGTGSLKRDSDPYKFQVFATDDDPDGDAFRIKIVNETTDEVVYDNGSKTPIEGGNIKVQEG